MNKTNFLIYLSVLAQLGCDPFSARQTTAQQFIVHTNSVSQKVGERYKVQIRHIQPYQVYRYQQALSDPFRVRAFVIPKRQKTEAGVNTPLQCLPPACVPPEPHTMTLLENYSLSSLGFVGTLTGNRQVGLIKTPDYGVVQVKVGEYIGQNNGKVIAINESSIILQEKMFNNGLWTNKKTVLVIKR